MSHQLEPRPTTPAPAPAAPLPAPLAGAVELAAERSSEPAERVVYVPDAYGRMVPVRRSQADALLAIVPATQPRDLAPQPVLDSRAQLVLAGGLGGGAAAAGLGYGLGQVLAPLAAIASSGALWAVCLAAALIGAGRTTARSGDTYITHNHPRWWGKTTTHNGR